MLHQTADAESSASSAGVAGAPAVRLIGLRKTYGDVVAIERLSLEIAEGEFFTMATGVLRSTRAPNVAAAVEGAAA